MTYSYDEWKTTPPLDLLYEEMNDREEVLEDECGCKWLCQPHQTPYLLEFCTLHEIPSKNASTLEKERGEEDSSIMYYDDSLPF